MTTAEFVDYCLELGFDVEDDDFDINVWVLSGRNKNVRNKIAWINKECPLNYKMLSISHPQKEKLADIIHIYSKTTRGKRGRKEKYKQPEVSHFQY